MTVPLVAALSASTSAKGTVAPRPGKDHGVSAVVAADAPEDKSGSAITLPANTSADVTASTTALTEVETSGRRAVGG
jgi:hypothetical protein